MGEIFMLTETVGNSVEKRAYELFIKRGEVHGHDQEDWFKAQKETNDLNVKTKSDKPFYKKYR
jgi:hypothetical protein